MQKVMTKPQILITGATGQQGGALAKKLSQKGTPFRAMSRSVHKLKFFQSQGMETVEGTFSDKEAIKRALTGIKQAFLVTTPFEEGVEAEIKLGKNFVDAAKEARLEHLVFSSVAGCDQKTGIPHFESKWEIEEHIKKSGIKATILRPVFFMENFESPWFLPDIKKGKLSLPVKNSVSMQMVALENIGAFAEAAMSRPSDFIGQTLELASDQLTFPEAISKISKESGKSVTYEEMPEKIAKEKYGNDFFLMFQWFNRVGYSVDIKALKKWSIPLTTFDTYLSNSEWVRKL